MIAERSAFLVPHDHLSLEGIIPNLASKLICYTQNENKNII